MHPGSKQPWPRSYGAYLFDLDGTLVDTAPDIHRALNHALRQHGYPSIDESLTRHFIGHGGRALVRAALEHHALPDTRADDLLAAFLEHYGAHIADFSQPYATVVSTLARLADRGCRLGIVTNKNSRLTALLTDALGLRGFFSAIVAGDSAAKPKPAPDPVHLAMRQLGVDSAETLFVGDSSTDVGAARAAGTAVVCVRYGYSQGIAAEALGADGIIGLFEELLIRETPR
jgi:phosphoglycolate phosphatase